MTAEHGDDAIHLEEQFGPLELIDIAAEAAAHEPWFNQTLTRVNDAVVRLGVIEGDFHWRGRRRRADRRRLSAQSSSSQVCTTSGLGWMLTCRSVSTPWFLNPCGVSGGTTTT